MQQAPTFADTANTIHIPTTFEEIANKINLIAGSDPTKRMHKLLDLGPVYLRLIGTEINTSNQPTNRFAANVDIDVLDSFVLLLRQSIKEMSYYVSSPTFKHYLDTLKELESQLAYCLGIIAGTRASDIVSLESIRVARLPEQTLANYYLNIGLDLGGDGLLTAKDCLSYVLHRLYSFQEDGVVSHILLDALTKQVLATSNNNECLLFLKEHLDILPPFFEALEVVSNPNSSVEDLTRVRTQLWQSKEIVASVSNWLPKLETDPQFPGRNTLENFCASYHALENLLRARIALVEGNSQAHKMYWSEFYAWSIRDRLSGISGNYPPTQILQNAYAAFKSERWQMFINSGSSIDNLENFRHIIMPSILIDREIDYILANKKLSKEFWPITTKFLASKTADRALLLLYSNETEILEALKDDPKSIQDFKEALSLLELAVFEYNTHEASQLNRLQIAKNILLKYPAPWNIIAAGDIIELVDTLERSEKKASDVVLDKVTDLRNLLTAIQQFRRGRGPRSYINLDFKFSHQEIYSLHTLLGKIYPEAQALKPINILDPHDTFHDSNSKEFVTELLRRGTTWELLIEAGFDECSLSRKLFYVLLKYFSDIEEKGLEETITGLEALLETFLKKKVVHADVYPIALRFLYLIIKTRRIKAALPNLLAVSAALGQKSSKSSADIFNNFVMQDRDNLTSSMQLLVSSYDDVKEFGLLGRQIQQLLAGEYKCIIEAEI